MLKNDEKIYFICNIYSVYYMYNKYLKIIFICLFFSDNNNSNIIRMFQHPVVCNR